MIFEGSFAADREQLTAEGDAGTKPCHGHGPFRMSTTAGPDPAVEDPRPKVLRIAARTKVQEIIAQRTYTAADRTPCQQPSSTGPYNTCTEGMFRDDNRR
jgi:hypothetical protein